MKVATTCKCFAGRTSEGVALINKITMPIIQGNKECNRMEKKNKE
jgi:hypothetical protein